METKMEAKIKSYILIDYTLKNLSPIVIGSGNESLYDVEIVRYSNGTPYIPGASLFGVLKHAFFKQHTITIKQHPITKDLDTIKNLTFFWGDISDYVKAEIKKIIADNKIEIQSHCIPKDILPDSDSYKISIRDRIRLNEQTLLTEEGSKFDFEMIEPNAKFNSSIKIKLREGIDDNIIHYCIQFIIEQLKNLHIGRKTNDGYGELQLENHTIKTYDGDEWNNYLDALIEKDTTTASDCGICLKDKIKNSTLTNEHIQLKPKSYFKAIITGSIINSLLVGSPQQLNDKTDKPYLPYHSDKKNKPLKGETYKQALIHRMKRIANTIGISKIIDINLLGTEKDKGQKGRISAKETKIDVNKITEKIHHRTMIDHFTGGGIKGALFDSTPLWHNEEVLQLEIKINDYKEYEAALLLHAIKDLAHEDIALGGEKSIGRGRIKGSKISLEWTSKNAENKKCVLELDKDYKITISEGKITELEAMNTTLQNFKTENHE